MKHIGNIKYADGAKHKTKRIARGPGSGHGGTATRGHKGAQSRRNYKTKRGFEGGQMPLHRRVPKFGFFNRFRVEYQVINVDRLQELAEANVFDNNNVNLEILYKVGAVSKRTVPVKVLGNGEITAPLNLVVNKISEVAKQKIESAGGTVTIHE